MRRVGRPAMRADLITNATYGEAYDVTLRLLDDLIAQAKGE